MTVWAAALWGLLGGFCVEALDLYAKIHTTPGWSWRKETFGLDALITALVIRLGVGAALAAAFAASGQVSGSIAAFSLGIASPLVVERLAKTAQVNQIVNAPTAAVSPAPVDVGAVLPQPAADPNGVADAR